MSLDLQRDLYDLAARLERLEKPDSGMASGASFPSSPSTGLLFYRTDLDLLCVYDGTRWITTDVMPMVLLPNRSTISVNTIWDTRVRADLALYVDYIALSTNAAATNNGTNFWTITIQGVNLALSAATTVYNPNTSADTAGVETDHSGSVSAGSVAPSNNHYLRVSAAKTLTPGNLTIACTAYVRYIVT